MTITLTLRASLPAPRTSKDGKQTNLVERLGVPVFAPPPDTADELVRKYGITPEQAGGSRREYRIPEVALLRSLFGNFDLGAELERLETATAEMTDDELIEALADD